jgi:hypothetical protein
MSVLMSKRYVGLDVLERPEPIREELLQEKHSETSKSNPGVCVFMTSSISWFIQKEAMMRKILIRICSLSSAVGEATVDAPSAMSCGAKQTSSDSAKNLVI